MTYREGLGAINIAVDRTAAIRSFQAQQRAIAATPQVSTPVLKFPAPRPLPSPVKPVPPMTIGGPSTGIRCPDGSTSYSRSCPLPPPPVFKPSVTSVPKPAVPTASVSMTPAPSTAILEKTSESVVGAFTKSPLPLIAVGLGALFLFTRKGRR